MRFDIISLFPEMFDAIHQGVTGRAIDNGLVHIKHWNPRDYTQDIHRTVDDRPYGGGPGMVMKVEPLRAAIDEAKSVTSNAKVIYLTPQGKRFNQLAAQKLAQADNLILLAGRYEGVDERLIESHIDEEWSIGDYVLSGGELPAMVLMDSVIRLLPDVLGHVDSAQQDSYSDGLLDCPHFTRPVQMEDKEVPEVLLSGNHENIRRWRLKQALGRTWLRRPDLLEGRVLTEEENNLLNEFINAQA